MNRQSSKASALIIVLLTAMAWFAVSNHCSLAVTTPTPEVMAVHAHCHGAPSEPTKDKSDEKLPCCKVLRATVASNLVAPANVQTGLLPAADYVMAELLSITEDHMQPLPEEIDTGPPFLSWFAELILQRSLFSHAPPFLV